MNGQMGRLGRTAIACVGALFFGLGGCAVSAEPVIEATASLPPDALAKGQIIQVDVGGQLWKDNVSMPLSSVRRDPDGQPVAVVCIASHNSNDPTIDYPLHLGETVALNDWATVTLVSFDKMGTRTQAVTFLFNG